MNIKMEEPSTSQLCHFSPEDGDNVSPKRWYLPTKPHGAKTQNITNT
jgi:hypothetical protein